MPARASVRQVDHLLLGFEQAAVGMAVMDLDGAYVRVNPALCDMLGRTERELLSSTSRGLSHPDDLEASNERFAAALLGQRDRLDFTKRYVRGDGSVLHAQVTSTMLRGADRDPIGFFVQVRDVGEQEHVLEELRAANARYRQILDTTRDGMALVTPAGDITFASENLAAMVGRSPSDLVGHSALEFTDEEGQAAFRAALARRAEGVREAYEIKLLHRDGRAVWTLVSATPIVEDGAVVGSLTMLTDITARRAALERERLLAAVVQSSDDAIASLAPDGTVTTWNAGAEALLGHGAPDVLGRPLWTIVPDERRAQIVDIFLRASGGGRISGIDTQLRHRDGHLLDVSLTVSAVTDASGQVVGVSAIGRDISARLDLSETLRRQLTAQAAVAQLGRFALEGHGLREVMESAVDQAARVLAVDIAMVAESVGSSLVVRAERGLPASAPTAVSVTGGEARTRAAEVLARVEASTVDDWSREPADTYHPALHAAGIAASASVPIDGRGAPYGMLSVHQLVPRAWGEDEVAFLQSVANVLADAIERLRSEAELRHQALHDALTELPNRTLLADRLAHALALAERRGSCTGVVLLDVDHFKLVNDSLGHDAGDRLLRALAPRLRDAVRNGDTVARLGGDEFVVLCEELDGEREALEVAARLLAVLEDPVVLEDGPRAVTASVGVAVARGGEAREAVDLLRDADAAMYRAKEAGRNRCVLFDAGMRAATLDRVATERDLRGALARPIGPGGELDLAFQPIVAIGEERIVAFEALARWRHPARGEVSPAHFIAVAEETGLVVPFGERILREACRHALGFAEVAGVPIPVHVNLSARQVADPELVERASRVLASEGLDPSLLVLELTETSLLEASEAPLEALGALRELGVGLELDDFGTGYSSLSYLKRFPVQGLKIDRSFIAELDRDTDDSLIVAAIVRMGLALGLTVTAEGVETPEQLTRLAALRCSRAQGYLLSRPMPAPAARALLTDARAA